MPATGRVELLDQLGASVEWIANLTNEKTRWAYKNDVSEFSALIAHQQCRCEKLL